MTFVFCSAGCLNAFEKGSERYVGRAEAQAASGAMADPT